MLSVVAIFRNEEPYLAEWIIFHRMQGFDHFLLYDNESTDGGGEIARAMGCEVVNWPGELQQLPAYLDAIARLPPDDWAAFIDIDEYLWALDGSTVAYQLGRYNKKHAIGVPWLMFGDGWHETKPIGFTIESYILREGGVNTHVKQILKPASVSKWRDPHHTDAPFARVDPYLYCNHYWTRSRAECEVKFARGRADYKVKRTMNEFDKDRELRNCTLDTRLRDLWAPRLHEAFLESSRQQA